VTDIEEKVHGVIHDQLGVADDELTSETLLIDDLGMDSIDLVEIVMELEETFGLEISDSDAEPWAKVGDVVAFVTRRLEPATEQR